MSSDVLYQGRELGKIRLADNNTGKFVFVAESLDSLIELFKLKPSDTVTVEDKDIPYDTFKEEYLKIISGFYPSFDVYVLKNYSAKTLEGFEASRKSE